jgi:hypothetical protein
MRILALWKSSDNDEVLRKEDTNMTACYDGALVFPRNYAPVTKEEMVYVDGGAYFSGADCRNVAVAIAGSGSGLLAIVGTAAAVTGALKFASLIGGPVAWIIRGAAGLVVNAMTKLLYGFGMGAVTGRGMSASFTLNFWEGFIKVNVH